MGLPVSPVAVGQGDVGPRPGVRWCWGARALGALWARSQTAAHEAGPAEQGWDLCWLREVAPPSWTVPATCGAEAERAALRTLFFLAAKRGDS